MKLNKLSEASGNVTAETLRPEQEAERLNDRGRYPSERRL